MQDQNERIIQVDIQEEVEKDFLEYAMSVIVSRALPDLRDGLKPVQRRIIYAMHSLGIVAEKPHKKSARIVGEVIGKYHPHGDSSVYEAMVRMAQDFSYRYPLIDGHGNFGSIDGDGAAAMRYTEARLSKITNHLINDIDMDTVDFRDNYDASETEPSFLPGYFPNLLVNGATGIAVGMSTSIPPHNLREVVSAIESYIDDPKIKIEDLLNSVKGPDFPTAGIINDSSLLKESYLTGKGNVLIRSKLDVEEISGSKKMAIVVTEIPYQTNKTKIIERIVELVKNKQIDEISNIRDESNYEGIRVVIELKKTANTQLVIKKLYKFTSLQVSFSIIFLALNNGVPKLMDLKTIIKNYVAYQIQVIIRRSKFEKSKLEKRLHILKALVTAIDNIDKVISIIRSSKTSEIAKENLTKEFQFDDEQNKAILEMRLQRLVGLEREKIIQDIQKVEERLQELIQLLNSSDEQNNLLKTQLKEIVDKFGDDRKTQITKFESSAINEEDLIENEKYLITISRNGYVRRLSLDEFKTQKRGGRGIKIWDNEEDPIVNTVVGKTRDDLMFFTNKGKVYKIKAYQIAEFNRAAKGVPVINYIGISQDELITSVLSFKDKTNKFKYLVFMTEKGIAKKTPIEEFDSINQSGKISIKLTDGNTLINVFPARGDETILIATKSGKLARVEVSNINTLGRSSFGIKGIDLDKTDSVIGACTDFNNDIVSTISELGLSKKTPIAEYKIIGRNSKGVKVMHINERTGNFKSIHSIRDSDRLILVSNKGNLLKVWANDIPLLGRNTLGVKIFKLYNDEIVTATTVEWNKDNKETIQNDKH